MAVTAIREMILAREPGVQIGSLPEIAATLEVGIETVRQASRLLEHEGFLTVRRGNRGGLFGARPGSIALGRVVSGFLRESQSHEREAIAIMTLLDCDLVAAAALSTNEVLREKLRDHATRIDECDTAEQRAAFVQEMHDILFKMVDRPLMEMMVRMSMQHYTTRTGNSIYESKEDVERWKEERHGIVYAILRRDAELARFEAQRRRDYVLQRVAIAEASV
ncbi:FadR/GntR family transcriptional regulator [Novosphingobium sp. 11B]